MKKRNGLWVIVAFGGVIHWAFASPSSEPSGFVSPAPLSILPSPSPSPSPSLSPVPSPVPQVILKASDWVEMQDEFLRAQSTELLALGHRQKFEFQELKLSQDARQREWESAEREARQKYFATHTKTAERNLYIKNYMKRKELFSKKLSDERMRIRTQQQTQLSRMKSEQSKKFKEFRGWVQKKVIPPKDLWPKAY